LIPIIGQEYNPKIVEALTRTADIIREEQIWMDSIVNELYERLAQTKKGGNIMLSVPDLKKIHPAAARRIIRKAVEEAKGNLRGVEAEHIEQVARLIKSEVKKGKTDFPGPIRIERQGDRIVIVRRKTAARPAKTNYQKNSRRPIFKYVIDSPQTVYIQETGAAIRISEYCLPSEITSETIRTLSIPPRCALMDMDSFSFPVTIRSFRTGDSFRPLGLPGSQKLKKFLINNKIPAQYRERIPILESRDKIIWVAGYRIDDSVRIKKTTIRVLKAEFLGQ
jgi:tRNA(Ile)-lysidine synthase